MRLFCNFARHKNGIIFGLAQISAKKNGRIGIIEANENQ
jgi:hypothetical protein